MSHNKHQLVFFPIISCIQKITLYEEKHIFYLIGSNYNTSRFRVLKIDRTDPRELTVVDDRVEYTKCEIVKLIDRIELAHRSRSTYRSANSAKLVSAYGIVGFVKFTEGYYLILITARQQVAVIGHHIIYKIKDTTLTYIPQDGNKNNNPVELKYTKIFQNIDLSSNFYFSYSYDLTHSLQNNMTPPSDFPLGAFQPNQSEETSNILTETLHFGVRSIPNDRFVWNWNLLKPVRDSVHPDWKLHIIHGFVDQSNISVYGRSIHVSLIARRSRKYAGTRFLKRGANFEGDVANEVETEQVVHDAGVSSFNKGRFSSFVQIRGSIPGHWSQDVSKMVPKPQIAFDLSDPFSETSGKHFNQLLRRYGSPIIILNLVKKRETKKQESVLTEEFIRNVRYLNQFLPLKHQMRYTSFDMARMNKTKNENVMQRLADIARSCVFKTGIFVSRPLSGQDGSSENGPKHQTGIVRVNCVDCLDRTNTAQFAVGRWALGLQLCALGVLRSPNLEFDTDCVRMLEALYEDHGDTLALQYGGSQLVHRIKTYRKTAPWTSQGNDIMQTLSRYYSNTFSDADKQNAINLFLGLFEPSEKGPHIWEMFSDYYLHQSRPMGLFEKRLRPITQWWDPEILPCLPRAYEEVTKRSAELYALRPEDEVVDGYTDCHKPQELTNLKDTFTFKISHSVRDFMPNFTTNFSPFAVRVRPGRRREESGKQGVKNPSMTGQSSTSSTTSSGTSSTSESDGSLSEVEMDVQEDSISWKQDEVISDEQSFSKLFPSMAEVYGKQPQPPSKADIHMYKKYERFQWNSIHPQEHDLFTFSHMMGPISKFSSDTSHNCMVPTVPSESIELYKSYVVSGVIGATEPSKKDLLLYRMYAAQA